MAISSRTFKSPGFLIAALSVLSLGVLALGLFIMLRPSASTTPAEEPATEETTEERKITALGRIEPVGGIYNVAAPSTAGASRVMQVLVQEGESVKQGDLLAVMDSHEQLRASVIQAQAEVEEAQSNLAQVEAGAKPSDIQAGIANANAEQINVEVQQADIEQQEANIQERVAIVVAKNAARKRIFAELKRAEQDLQKAQALVQEKAIAQDVFDQRALAFEAKTAELEQAEAEIAQAVRQLEQAKQQKQESIAAASRQQQKLSQALEQVTSLKEVRPEDVQRAQTAVKSAIAKLARAQADLNQSVVAAPINGQVLEIHTSGGEAVGEEGILDLARTDQMTVVAEVYETDIRDVKIGQRVQVNSPALATSLRGLVGKVGLKIDKQDVLDADPTADTDGRVVEVTILLENSSPVASLTNLQVNVAIDTAAPILRSAPAASSDPAEPDKPFAQPSSPGGLLDNGLLEDSPLNNAPNATDQEATGADNAAEAIDGSES